MNPAIPAEARADALKRLQQTEYPGLIEKNSRLYRMMIEGVLASHGKEGVIERFSTYHRRAAILSADAIVAFLHQAYRETNANLAPTREPYERFHSQNAMIDEWCSYCAADINEDGLIEVTVAIPGPEGRPETITLEAPPSQFLFHLDCTAYPYS